MQKELRSAVPTRMAALGFILLTVVGNIWLIYLLTGDEAPIWLINAFHAGLVLAMAGGVGMVIWRLLRPAPQTETSHPEGDSEVD